MPITPTFVDLISLINSTERNVKSETVFGKSTRTASLNIIGADYFITEFGLVIPNEFDGNALPLVERDAYYPYKWVKLTIGGGQYWFPVNLLLGWAFTNESLDPKHPREFAIDDTCWGLQPMSIDKYHWRDIDLHRDTLLRSHYLEFLRAIYSVE